jgi:hypothetical protein
MGRGPHLGPLTAWVRPRQEAARVLVGGRNLGAAGAPATRFTVAANDAPLAAWDVAPGFFLRVFDVPAGALAAGPDGWARLTIAATPADTGGPAAAVEQFDLQSAGSVMWGFADGWHEAELDPIAGPWRWTSARATLLVDGATTPLTLRMRVESPRRHFDGPAHVRVAAGDRTLASWTVDTDTELDVEIPLDALAGAAGRLVVETDRTFVPADRDGGADRRQLGLRVLSVDIVPARAALR